MESDGLEGGALDSVTPFLVNKSYDYSQRSHEEIRPNTAVDHISFEVQKGQIVGFLGPNGAGKTTTMRMLTCFLPPTAGTRHRGRIRRARAADGGQERIGYLPETPPLYPEMEAAEYLDICRQAQGAFRRQRCGKRIDYVAEPLRHRRRAAQADRQASKGYRQRVGLAQAIIHNPDVLILDEPTAGLDPKQINETRDLIKSLAGDHTIILSTHILPEVEQTCEQVIIINKGKLVATDSVQQPAEPRARRRIRAGRSGRTQRRARCRRRSSSGWNRLPASAACC